MSRNSLKTLLQLAFLLAPLASHAQQTTVSPSILDTLTRAGEVTCMAYWEGFVYNSSTKSCEQRGASGCSNPFEFLSHSSCEAAHSQQRR